MGREHPFGEGDFVMSKQLDIEVWESGHIPVRLGPVYGVLADNTNPRWRIMPDSEDVIKKMASYGRPPGFSLYKYNHLSGKYELVRISIPSVEDAQNICEWGELMYLSSLGGPDGTAQLRRLTSEERATRLSVLNRAAEMNYLQNLWEAGKRWRGY